MNDIRLSALAREDLLSAVEYYCQQAPHVAERFVDALDQAMHSTARSPNSGSHRFADLLDIPGLRCRKVAGFPYLVFYLVSGDEVMVGRVLHEARDLGSLLAEFD